MTEENPRIGEIIIYTAPDGTAQAEVRMEANTLWLTEQQIATVFERDRTVIGRHIKKINKTGELIEESNVQKMHIANIEGVPYSDAPAFTLRFEKGLKNPLLCV